MRPIRALTHGAAHIRFVVLPTLWLALFAYAGRPLVIAARAEGVPAAMAWLAIFITSLLPILPALVRRDDALRKRSAMHWIGYATLAALCGAYREQPELTLREVDASFERIAATSGKGSALNKAASSISRPRCRQLKRRSGAWVGARCRRWRAICLWGNCSKQATGRWLSA